MTCIFIFINVILYLISVIFVCKGSAGDFFEDDEDELNDVEVNNFDLNQSLRSNSWNRSRKSKTRREEVIFFNHGKNRSFFMDKFQVKYILKKKISIKTLGIDYRSAAT